MPLEHLSHTKNVLCFPCPSYTTTCPILVNESQHDDFWQKGQGSALYDPYMRN